MSHARSNNHRKINIFTGFLGSGKTEVALNYALGLRYGKINIKSADKNVDSSIEYISFPTVSSDENVFLIDLDFVNPYFCSREAKKILEEKNVRTITPPENMRFSDLPVLVNEAFQVFNVPTAYLVVDVGGDEQGVLTLGHFRPWLQEDKYNFWLVVNPYRPFNEDIKGIEETCERIEAASRLHLSGLISNPHLGSETTVEVIQEGHAIVVDAAKKKNLPVEALVVHEDLLNKINYNHIKRTLVFPIKIYVYPDWFFD